MNTDLYEITGGRQPYYMRATNDAVAFVAVLLVGGGTCGFRHLRRKGITMPIWEIPESMDLWVKDVFGMSRSQLEKRVASHHVEELHSALESIRLGLPGDTNVPRPKERWDLEAIAKKRAEAVKGAVYKSLKRHKTTRH